MIELWWPILDASGFVLFLKRHNRLEEISLHECELFSNNEWRTAITVMRDELTGLRKLYLTCLDVVGQYMSLSKWQKGPFIIDKDVRAELVNMLEKL